MIAQLLKKAGFVDSAATIDIVDKPLRSTACGITNKINSCFDNFFVPKKVINTFHKWIIIIKKKYEKGGKNEKISCTKKPLFLL